MIEGLSDEEMKEIEIKKWETISIDEHFKLYIDEGKDQKEAMKLVAKDRGISKREVYQIIHQIK